MNAGAFIVPNVNVDIAGFCRRHRAVSIEQVGALFDMERSWAQRQAAKLVRDGSLGRKRLNGMRGRPRWVYGPRRQRGANRVEHIQHTLLRTQVLVNFVMACSHVQNVQVDYRVEHELPVRRDPVPDAALILCRNEKASLVLLEVCRGTETIQASLPETRDLTCKMVAHARFIDEGGYKRYEQEFGGREFSGHRVLLVTSSWARIETLERALATRQEDFGFVWATTFDDATPRGILTNPIWKPIGERRRYALLTSTKRAQKAGNGNRGNGLLGRRRAPRQRIRGTPNNR